MKTTRLDGKKRPYIILIDRRDIALYRAHRWQRHTKGLIRYPSKKHHCGSIFLHRAIMGVGSELYVVHRNGNKFDCRRKNLEVITWQEQRDRKRVPRKPYFITRTRKGTPTGVAVVTHTHRWANGKMSIYRRAVAHFCFQRKEKSRGFSFEIYGEWEAKRRALEWRAQMIRKHGMEPNVELLDQIASATTKAAAEAYVRPPKAVRSLKPPKPSKAPKLPKLKLPKPPKVKLPKPPKIPKLRVPKPPKAKRPRRKRTPPPMARRLPARASNTTPVPFTVMDLPGGLVEVEHETLHSGQTAALLLDATDLHFYLLRPWMINCDGILCSGLGRNQIRLHRLIIGATPGERVVFRNKNTFDLRRENLVLGGICRNTMGFTAHGVYPFYVRRGGERVLWGVRTVVVPPGKGIARERRLYRHFSFEKYGEQEAWRRAYTLRIETMQARGEPVPADLFADLDRVTNSSDHGNRPVSKQSASFFRLMSVGGALAK